MNDKITSLKKRKALGEDSFDVDLVKDARDIAVAKLSKVIIKCLKKG